MNHAYRSPAYTRLERCAIDLATRHRERHDALELAADCQKLLEDAGFERAWMTTDTRRTDSTQRLWQYICTQELYYCREDALVLICYTSHSPFSPHPGKTACCYLQSASEKVSRFVEFKTQRADSLFDIAGILLERTMALCDIKEEIDRRGIHNFEDALLHAVRYSYSITSAATSGKTK